MVKSFLRCCIYLANFSYWSKFDANILTAFGAITIFVSKGFDQKSRNGKDPVGVLSNIQKLWQVNITNFGMLFSHEKLLNAAKCQVYSLYCF